MSEASLHRHPIATIRDAYQENRLAKLDARFSLDVVSPVPTLTRVGDRIRHGFITLRSTMERSGSRRMRPLFLVALIFGVVLLSVSTSDAASAQVAPPVDTAVAVAINTTPASIVPIQTTGTTTVPGATGPTGPAGPEGGEAVTGDATLSLNLGDALNKPSQSILIIIATTVLSVAPALLIMLTSFTRIIIVLSLTRNALGVMSIPPNQVLTGLALFLSLYIMTPTFTAMNTDAIQPYLRGEMSQTQAYTEAVKPLKTFMLKQTRDDELKLFVAASTETKPEKAEDVSMAALAPAFILSEVKTAFIIGFVIFIPFLVIDIIVSSSLMSMGMMMLPPQMISLPFKILLFVLVDGWGLIIKSLLSSFN